MALAVLTAWILWSLLLRREGLPVQRVLDVGFWSLIAGLVGAKLTLYLVELPRILRETGVAGLWPFVKDTIRSAGVIWGGILAGLLVFVLLARRRRLPLARMLDTAAVVLPLAQAIGRVGCFLAGCCYGRYCELPIAVTFPPDPNRFAAVPVGLPLHPVQLYEAAASLLVAAVVFLVLRRGKGRPGSAALVYLVLYAVLRFVVELFRGDPERGVYDVPFLTFDLSTAQVTSIVVLVGVAVFLLLRRTRRGSGESPGAGDDASKRRAGEA